MKILILGKSLSSGGAQRVMTLWANGFVQRGHNVVIGLSKPRNDKDFFTVDAKIQVKNIYGFLCLKLTSKFPNIKHWRMARRLRKLICDYKPDVVISTTPWMAIWVLEAVEGLDVRVINTFHESFERPSNVPMPEILKICMFQKINLFSAVTVLTDADKRHINDKNLKVYVFPNPLTFSSVLTIPQKEKIVLAAGRFDSWYYKGFDLLIEAWGQISSHNLNWKLYIAGTGSENNVSYLKNLVNKYEVADTVVFPGFCDMLPLYKKASIFVLSSRYEAFGMVLTEAMSQGCACIACDYKGRQSEIITQEDEGIICPVENVPAIASALNKLIKDEDLRCKIQNGALKRANFFKLENCMSRWESIINDVTLSNKLK